MLQHLQLIKPKKKVFQNRLLFAILQNKTRYNKTHSFLQEQIYKNFENLRNDMYKPKADILKMI